MFGYVNVYMCSCCTEPKASQSARWGYLPAPEAPAALSTTSYRVGPQSYDPQTSHAGPLGVFHGKLAKGAED